jgi:hypothetical protein
MVSRVARLANQIDRTEAEQRAAQAGRGGAAAGRPIEPKVRPTAAPRRGIVTCDDQLSPAYQTSIHEAGHVLELLIHGAADHLRSACVTADGGETVYTPDGLDRVPLIRMLVGGWAAVIQYGFPATGAAKDFDDLSELGVTTVQPLAFGGNEETWELAGWRAMAAADVRRHREFIDRLADELFLARPAPVGRAKILELWQRFGND